MSFILDALKKSENERQRTIGPSLADAPLRIAPTERPWWAMAVAALLVVNLAVLAFVLLRNEDPAPAPVAPPQASPPAVAAAPVETPAPRTAPPAPRTGSNPAVRSLAEEAAAGEYYDVPIDGEYIDPAYPGLASAANIPAGPPVVRPIEPPAVAPLQNRPTYQQPRPTASDEILPTASALIASGTSLPEMRLDIHVYSNTPADRFVFINMRKYTEGQTTSEGPTVERITPDGAVLNQGGLRFLLPRQ